MHLAGSTVRLPLVVLGAMLVVAGLVLTFERIRTDGPLRLWPLLLIVVGTGRAAAGPWEQRDEGLWLIGTGVWLLVETLAPLALRGAGPLALAAAGLMVVAQATSTGTPSPAEQRRGH